jgi:hypothetical protein
LAGDGWAAVAANHVADSSTVLTAKVITRSKQEMEHKHTT